MVKRVKVVFAGSGKTECWCLPLRDTPLSLGFVSLQATVMSGSGVFSAAPSQRYSTELSLFDGANSDNPITSLNTFNTMTGFEVVGIVLGALPIAVKAAQGYMAILSSVKDAHRNLKALIRDLETENIRLQTTCELLLDGIAPPSVVDKLIQTPFGPDWKPYNDQLRLRLWTTAGKFEEQVVEMRNAADELRAKLCLEPDGSVGLFLPHLDIGRTDRVDRPNSLIVWLSAES